MMPHYIDHVLFLQSALPLISVTSISKEVLKWLLPALKMGDWGTVRSSGGLLASKSACCQLGIELLPLIFRPLWEMAKTLPWSQLPFPVSFRVCVFLLEHLEVCSLASREFPSPLLPPTDVETTKQETGRRRKVEGSRRHCLWLLS